MTAKTKKTSAKKVNMVKIKSSTVQKMNALYRSEKKMIAFLKNDADAQKVIQPLIDAANKKYNTDYKINMLTTKIFLQATDYQKYGKKAKTTANKRKQWSWGWTTGLITKAVEQYAQSRKIAKTVKKNNGKGKTTKTTVKARKTAANTTTAVKKAN